MTAKVGIDSARLALQNAELAQIAARTRFEVGVGDRHVVSALRIHRLSNYSEQILQYNSAVVELSLFSNLARIGAQKLMLESIHYALTHNHDPTF